MNSRTSFLISGRSSNDEPACQLRPLLAQPAWLLLRSTRARARIQRWREPPARGGVSSKTAAFLPISATSMRQVAGGATRSSLPAAPIGGERRIATPPEASGEQHDHLVLSGERSDRDVSTGPADQAEANGTERRAALGLPVPGGWPEFEAGTAWRVRFRAGCGGGLGAGAGAAAAGAPSVEIADRF